MVAGAWRRHSGNAGLGAMIFWNLIREQASDLLLRQRRSWAFSMPPVPMLLPVERKPEPCLHLNLPR